MKKLMLIVAFAGVASFAFAQKPTEGDKTAEVGLNLQTGTAPISYTAPELRFRMFKSDDMAYRLRVSLGSTSNSTKMAMTGFDYETKTSSGFGISLSPGIEKHMKGTSKLSPYMGAELNIGFGTSAKDEATNGSSMSMVSAANGDSYSQTYGSTFGLGAAAVMGADYYVADGVYIGIEYRLGLFNMTSNGEGETKTKISGVETTAKSGSSSSFDLFGVSGGGVRLGYKF